MLHTKRLRQFEGYRPELVAPVGAVVISTQFALLPSADPASVEGTMMNYATHAHHESPAGLVPVETMD